MFNRLFKPSTRTTSFLLAIAALLIVNSHLEPLYPFSWLAADGLLGNALFFLLIGFGIFESKKKNGEEKFIRYYWKRILRLYPALIITVLIFCFLPGRKWNTWSISDYLFNFVVPSRFGFVPQVLVCYVLLYFAVKIKKSSHLLALLMLCFVPYIVLYAQGSYKVHTVHFFLGYTDIKMWYVFYFQMMLLGGYLSIAGQKGFTVHVGRECFFSAIILGAYIAVRFLINADMRLPAVGSVSNYWVVLHLLTFGFVWFAFRLTTSAMFIAFLQKHKWCNWVTGIIGGLTLEMYFIHSYLLEHPIVYNLMFPLNVLTLICLTIMFAILISFSVRMVRIAASSAVQRKCR